MENYGVGQWLDCWGIYDPGNNGIGDGKGEGWFDWLSSLSLYIWSRDCWLYWGSTAGLYWWGGFERFGFDFIGDVLSEESVLCKCCLSSSIL